MVDAIGVVADAVDDVLTEVEVVTLAENDIVVVAVAAVLTEVTTLVVMVAVVGPWST